MEQPSSIENQPAMPPVYGNMANLCLLCASAQNPKEQPFLDIHGKRGKQLKILDKIHNFLTITIEAGFPLQVCPSCVGKLNVCHKLVQSSEKAYRQLKKLQKEWKAEHEKDTKKKPLNKNFPQKEYSVPSKVDVMDEDEEFETPVELEIPKETAEENQPEEFPMLQKPFLVVKGSQIAIFIAEEDTAVKLQFSLSLLLIKNNEDGTNNKETASEKISRIMEHIKHSVPTKQSKPGGKEKSLSSSNQLLHFCHSCRCSFFLQEEMVSHFESLHPEEVHQCTVCAEKICGPVQMQEKHMELHRALEEGQTDELLKVPSSDTTVFDPEFFVIELGIFPPHLHRQLSESLQSTFKSIIQRNKWVKQDMKNQLYESVPIFATNIRRHKNNRRVKKRVRKPDPKVECDVCGKQIQKKRIKIHMETAHNPEKIKCPHCNYFYMLSDENSHIESQHNGGKILICKICDLMFSATGEDQPHMTPTSDFPFNCSQRHCKKVFQSDESLENHKKTAHQPKSNKSDTPPNLCDLCGKVYVEKSNLKKHLISVHFPNKNTAITVYPCDLCEVTYKSKAYLKRHKTSFHGPKFPCAVCGIMLSIRTLPRHMKLHDDDCKIPCKHCGKLFITQALCEAHEKSAHEGISFRCKLCPDLYFKSLKGVTEHKLKHELGEEIILPPYLQPAQCSICSENFPNSIRLKQHIKVHEKTGYKGVIPRRKRKAGEGKTKKNNDEPPPEKKRRMKVREVTVPCYVCLIRFMTQESFDSHLEIHHPNGVSNEPPSPVPKASKFRYQCRYCEKTFKKKDFCNDHETLHGTGKQYACDFCGKEYSYYSDKWTHQTKKCAVRHEVAEGSAQ